MKRDETRYTWFNDDLDGNLSSSTTAIAQFSLGTEGIEFFNKI